METLGSSFEASTLVPSAESDDDMEDVSTAYAHSQASSAPADEDEASYWQKSRGARRVLAKLKKVEDDEKQYAAITGQSDNDLLSQLKICRQVIEASDKYDPVTANALLARAYRHQMTHLQALSFWNPGDDIPEPAPLVAAFSTFLTADQAPEVRELTGYQRTEALCGVMRSIQGQGCRNGRLAWAEIFGMEIPAGMGSSLASDEA